MQPNNTLSKIKDGAVIVSLSAIVFASCALYYKYHGGRGPVASVADNRPAAEQRIGTGSTVVEKKIVTKEVMAKQQTPAQKLSDQSAERALKQETGKSFKKQRQVDVTLTNVQTGEQVTAQVSTLKAEDGETRTHLATQNEDWKIDGLDTLVEQPAPKSVPKNAIGVWSSIDQSERGVFYERDVGRVRLGVDVGVNKDNRAKVVVRAGVTF